jgi:riboflavin kinase/FMN adenylyltransferase
MRIFRSLAEVPVDFGPSAITIGNFDGVHLGHRRILKRVRELAAANGWRPSVLTFDPHPTTVVAPHRAPRLLTSPGERVSLMAEEGIEQALILPFDRALAALSPDEFVRQLLVERLDTRAVLVGENFCFGRNQSGNTAVLRALGEKLGFTVEIVDAVACRGRLVSSSAIRDLIRRGDVATAARYLKRPYALEGEVVSGRGVGSRQTVPTLNLATPAAVIPASGVYLTRTRDLGGGRRWDSLTNVGYRPTFGESGELSIETYLLGDFSGDTPGRIAVEFLKRVREERRFGSPEELKARIGQDAAIATRFFRRLKEWVRPIRA